MARSRKSGQKGLEIDFEQLLGAVWKNIWVVGLSVLLGTVLALVGTLLFITPRYESSVMFYVNNSSIRVDGGGVSIDASDISASKSLVDSYSVILQTRLTMEKIISYTGVDKTVSELKDMISANSVNGTEFFSVVVSSPDPQEALLIAEGIMAVLPERIDTIIDGTSAKVVDPPVLETTPAYPSHTLNGIIGAIVGLLLSVSAVTVAALMDVTIQVQEDITELCSHPVLAAVPDMSFHSKSTYYSYASKQPGQQGNGKQLPMVGSGISFAAAEAYKLLRTKLQFSFAEVGCCHVIGVTSAMAGEGKSLSSVNLAYSLSQLDKRVLLVDCDLRRPTVSGKLPVRRFPGLSNYLTGQSSLKQIFQPCGISGEEEVFDVIVAGRNPPNPVELLGSERMGQLLELLREKYDYVILDLPPVGEVSDALAVAKWTDGVMLVVRQSYCNRKLFQDMLQQLSFINCRILGIIYNCATENSGSYTKKYYKRYHRSYEGNYAAKEPPKGK